MLINTNGDFGKCTVLFWIQSKKISNPFILPPLTGSNILYVGIYGPKTPVDDLHVKHQGRGIYNVNYMVKDRGEYILIIKWGEDHVPGSPFKIDC